MALDLSILEVAVDGRSLPALRVYGWDRPTLSVGTNTLLPTEVIARCRDEGVSVVRRPTGGGAVLHGSDLTYSVVAPQRGSVIECYRWVALALIAGLRTIGVDCDVIEHSRAPRAIDCFGTPTGADLESGGRKICGSAQLRRRGWFLQHGSIPLIDQRPTVGYLLGTDPSADASTWLGAFGEFGFEDCRDAVIEGFRVSWGSDFEVTLPSGEEEVGALAGLEARGSALLTL